MLGRFTGMEHYRCDKKLDRLSTFSFEWRKLRIKVLKIMKVTDRMDGRKRFFTTVYN